MTQQEQIKALAELDGFRPALDYNNPRSGFYRCFKRGIVDGWIPEGELPTHYLTSYDAIIQLIQKRITSMCWHSFQDALGLICAETFSKSEGENHRYEGDGSYQESWLIFQATPAQLCEALLRATGKWKD